MVNSATRPESSAEIRNVELLPALRTFSECLHLRICSSCVILNIARPACTPQEPALISIEFLQYLLLATSTASPVRYIPVAFPAEPNGLLLHGIILRSRSRLVTTIACTWRPSARVTQCFPSISPGILRYFAAIGTLRILALVAFPFPWLPLFEKLPYDIRRPKVFRPCHLHVRIVRRFNRTGRSIHVHITSCAQHSIRARILLRLLI